MGVLHELQGNSPETSRAHQAFLNKYHKLGPFLTAPRHRNQKKQALTYVKAMVLSYL